MDLHDKMQRAVGSRRRLEEESKAKFANISRGRLQENIRKKMQTTFIGAIAQIEQTFGILWGNKRRRETMSETEERFFDMFQTVRNSILNLGNAQLRAIESELQTYNVVWNRHHTDFVINKKEE